MEYNECKNIIQDADVLLFRGGKFPGIGWFIAKYSQSPYSHVGLAYWENNELYVLEFREFKGARKYKLQEYVDEYPGRIDVFRACLRIEIPKLVTGTDVNQKLIPYCSHAIYNFTKSTQKRIVTDALNLINNHIEYGYRLIWRIAKTYCPLLRLFQKVPCKDCNGNLYVCSTLVTKTYRKHFLDPVPFLADEYTKPGDLARSSIFRKLFTIG